MVFLQRTIECVGGADEAEVSEGLRKISEMFACRPKFLRVKPDMVRVTEHFFEDEPALERVAGTREAFGIPEGAHAEGAFLAGQAVRRGRADAISMDKRVFNQLALDCLHRGMPAAVI